MAPSAACAACATTGLPCDGGRPRCRNCLLAGRTCSPLGVLPAVPPPRTAPGSPPPVSTPSPQSPDSPASATSQHSLGSVPLSSLPVVPLPAPPLSPIASGLGLAPGAFPVLVDLFFSGNAFSLMHRGIFQLSNGSPGAAVLAPKGVGRAYRHPLVLLVVAWIGCRTAAVGRDDSAGEASLVDGSLGALANRLRAAVEREMEAQFRRIFAEVRTAGVRGRAAMTPDNLAVVLAALLSLRAFRLDRSGPFTSFLPFLVTVLNLIREMGVVAELAAARNRPADPETFVLDQEWLSALWAAVVFDLNTFSGKLKGEVVIPWAEINQLQFPAAPKVVEGAAHLCAAPDSGLLIDAHSSAPAVAERIADVVATASPRPYSFAASGLPAFAFAVAALRARVRSLEATLAGAALSMADLAIVEDHVRRGAVAPNPAVAGHPDIHRLLRRRRELLDVVAALRSALPKDLAAMHSRGSVPEILAYSLRTFSDPRTYDLWTLLLFFAYTETVLLGQSHEVHPRAMPDPMGWDGLYALTPDFLSSVELVGTASSYARSLISHRRAAGAVLPPIATSSWIACAGFSLGLAQWVRLRFPRSEANAGIAGGLLDCAEGCLAGVRSAGRWHPRTEVLEGEVERERGLG